MLTQQYIHFTVVYEAQMGDACIDACCTAVRYHNVSLVSQADQSLHELHATLANIVKHALRLNGLAAAAAAAAEATAAAPTTVASGVQQKDEVSSAAT
jgi:hypothetical protein